MNPFRQISPLTCRKLQWLVPVTVLLTAGCAPPADVDLEPILGKYRVTLSPDTVLLTPDSPTATVTASVVCEGNNLPPDCAGNDPRWVVAGFFGSLLTATYNPDAPTTDVTLTFDFPAITDFVNEAARSLGCDVKYIVGIRPSRIPSGLQLAGECNVNVKVSLPGPGGDRAEDPSTEPRLIPFPSVGKMWGCNSEKFKIVYKGPATSVTSITKGGNNPDKFNVSAPSLPFDVEDTDIFGLDVLFLFTGGDTNTCSTQISIQTASGAFTSFTATYLPP
jgi:hypothetical protein